ncbi:MAG: hypothetical protein H0T51_03260 [Pirellulales bacterium]|nr:hypothetical protein [Pirellulales bacterium]
MLNDLVTLAASSATGDPWADTFFGLDANQRFVALLTVVGCVTGVIISLAGIIYAAFDASHRRRTEANLKREMLDRGMSVDEVVKVIEAASPPEDAAGRWIASWCRGRK